MLYYLEQIVNIWESCPIAQGAPGDLGGSSTQECFWWLKLSQHYELGASESTTSCMDVILGVTGVGEHRPNVIG